MFRRLLDNSRGVRSVSLWAMCIDLSINQCKNKKLAERGEFKEAFFSELSNDFSFSSAITAAVVFLSAGRVSVKDLGWRSDKTHKSSSVLV